MSRGPFFLTVTDETTGAAVLGANVRVKRRSDLSDGVIYPLETGGAPGANPLPTDAHGRVVGYMDRGAYRATVSGTGITTYDVDFDIAPAADGSVDTSWLSPGAIPIGVCLPYSGPADPVAGVWLICDGRALSRAGYAALFALYGGLYGAGDGSTTFNIPDLRDRVPVGASATIGGGSTGGEKTHALSIAELPIHNHGIVDPGHHHTFPQDPIVAAAGGGGGLHVGGDGTSISQSSDSPTGILTTQTAGSGTAHNVMQPYLALNYVVRAL